MISHTILWRRLDHPGHEIARLAEQPTGWCMRGAAIFEFDRVPCEMHYAIACDSVWKTKSTVVQGWIGTQKVRCEITVNGERRWSMNGKDVPEVLGSADIDLNFSPSTNLLPVRRLQLAVGDEAEVRAAFLRFPELTFELLPQIYTRLDTYKYRYSSAGGRFVRELKVNGAGFVIEYPDLFEAVLQMPPTE